MGCKSKAEGQYVDDHLANNNRDELALSDGVVSRFRVAKLFKENKEFVNSIDFSRDGELMVTSGNDEQIVVYDCLNGAIKRGLKSKKYGVDLIRFTHTKNTVVHVSTKIDDSIRYLSLHDNKYIRYYSGHTDRMTTLCVSPVDDTILSASLDKTLRLWDLRAHECQGLMHLQGNPVASFDNQGVIFAVGLSNERMRLYDLRSFDKGPFLSFQLPFDNNEWSSLKFSPDGKQIMLTMAGGSLIRVVDAFNGVPLLTLTGCINSQKLSYEATYSPDSKYIFSGSEFGKVLVWNAKTGSKVCMFHTDHHPQAIRCIKFNPKYMMLASACKDMCFWIPIDNATSVETECIIRPFHY